MKKTISSLFVLIAVLLAAGTGGAATQEADLYAVRTAVSHYQLELGGGAVTGYPSGVTEGTPSEHTFGINSRGGHSVLVRETDEPQLMIVQLTEADVLSCVTPTLIGTGASVYPVWVAGGEQDWSSSAQLTSGVTLQFFYYESSVNTTNWSAHRKRQATPVFDCYSGNTENPWLGAIVTGKYIRPTWQGGTTAWADVQAKVRFVDLPAQMPTGMMDEWEVGTDESDESGGSRFGVAANATIHPSATTGYPLEEAAELIEIQPNGNSFYYTTNGEEATTDDSYIEDGDFMYFTRKEYEDLNALMETAAYYTVRQYNLPPNM